MIAKMYLKRKVCGNKPQDIEGYEEAMESEEMYVPHHVLEWKYTIDELKAMGHYDKVSPEELIWMPKSVHNTNKWLHKGITFNHMKGNQHLKGHHIGSFVKKFIEHFGITPDEDIKLYYREKTWYGRHNKVCRWEAPND